MIERALGARDDAGVRRRARKDVAHALARLDRVQLGDSAVLPGAVIQERSCEEARAGADSTMVNGGWNWLMRIRS